MTSMKFCRGGLPITPGAWQTHTDHACQVAIPATWHGVPRPGGLDEALAHARGVFGNPAVAGADHISGGDPGRAPDGPESLTRAAEQIEQATGADFDTAAQLARQAVSRCAYCGHRGKLEPIGNQAGNLACANTVLCELRQGERGPVGHLLAVAQAVGKDVDELSAYELACLAYVLKATVVAAESELGGRPGRDEETASAAQDCAPRR